MGGVEERDGVKCKASKSAKASDPSAAKVEWAARICFRIAHRNEVEDGGCKMPRWSRLESHIQGIYRDDGRMLLRLIQAKGTT